MSNERIDLTQFERLPKKMEIKWHEHPLYGARYLVQISEPKTPWAVGSIAPDYEPHGVYAKDKIEQEKMAKMFASTPDLIAELKRCYEILDRIPKDILTNSPCEECNTVRIGYYDNNICEHDTCNKCDGCCTCASE